MLRRVFVSTESLAFWLSSGTLRSRVEYFSARTVFGLQCAGVTLISPDGGKVTDEPTHGSAHRQFRDERGIYWEVWEVHPRGRDDLIPPGMRRDLELVPPELAVGWLAFESAGERRRHAPIPLGWAERTRLGLIELLEEAKVVRPSGPIWPARAEDLEISPQ